MRVVLTGLSHKTATVQLREKLSLYGRSSLEALHGLRDAARFRECAILSTCNRTEFYGLTREEDWQEQVLQFMSRLAGVTPGSLQDHLYWHEGQPAVRHLFRVAAGLDSMVVGEGQVLAQVKEALQDAQEATTSGTVVHTLFQYAIAAGKRARSETEIGRGAVSISLAAVQLARQIFPRLRNHVVLLIGAGETGEQTAKMLLADAAAPQILVCNRTEERAAALAGQFGGTAMGYDRLPDALIRADIVITSTGAPHVILTEAQLRQAMRARRGRPLFLIDIAVPRDVEPEAGDLDDVYLYNIDDLQQVVEKNLAGRQVEASRVETLLEEEIEKFQGWIRGLEVAPTIKQLQVQAQQIVENEWERVGGRLSHLSDRDRDMVDTLVKGVVNKLLRPPILRLKEAADSGNGYHEVEAVRAIFGLGGADERAEDSGEPEEGMTLDQALFYLTLLLYFASSVCYHAHLFTGSEGARKLALWLVPAGVIAHTAALGAWCLTHPGASILREPGMPVSMVAFFLALVQAVLSFLRGWTSLGSLSLPLAFIAQAYAAQLSSAGTPHLLTGSRLLSPHVMPLLLGFAAFTLAFCLAVTYLIEASLLKAKQIRGVFRRMPPLESLSNGSHWLAAIGFSMLTLGIVTGAIAAPTAWKSAWYLDYRALTSFVAWAVYAAYLGVSLCLGWRGRRTTYFLIAGYLVILVAFVASVQRPKMDEHVVAPTRSRGIGSQRRVGNPSLGTLVLRTNGSRLLRPKDDPASEGFPTPRWNPSHRRPARGKPS